LRESCPHSGQSGVFFMTDLPAWLVSRGCTVPSIGLLQPADPFLDTAGEELRRRIFITTGQRGEALCLRPEFTIPVCLHHLAGEGAAARYGYFGTVFRQRQDEPAEFRQAGIEDIGNADRLAADARSIADALALCVAVAGHNGWRVTLGDQAVFEAVVRALGLPSGWRKKLARSFGAPDKVEALIASLGSPRERAAGHPEDITAALEAGDAPALAAAIAARMEQFGFAAAASRTPGEIAARMLEQSALDNARLTQEHIADLRAFLAIRMPLDRAGEALRSFAGRLDGDMGPVLGNFDARVAGLQAQGVDPASITYDAAFGRPLDYYTGLVYEISAPGSGNPVAGGGRYDRLLTLLGARSEVPGVGFSVWLDRLEAAK
jgi:ATP phosphoribosyltransferase regulatory subunit